MFDRFILLVCFLLTSSSWGVETVVTVASSLIFKPDVVCLDDLEQQQGLGKCIFWDCKPSGFMLLTKSFQNDFADDIRLQEIYYEREVLLLQVG